MTSETELDLAMILSLQRLVRHDFWRHESLATAGDCDSTSANSLRPQADKHDKYWTVKGTKNHKRNVFPLM